jgi:hypothetical protein
MTEDAKRAFARNLATWGALAAFLTVFGGIVATWGVNWDLAFWPALAAAVTAERLGTMRSTKGRWL